ncbi:PAS domain S-box protein [Pontibacter silvestris]|uniref:histidine kinase n=1 Tax=Pontibacter silvestris TaxID=2305183 RepID=A0ABW4WV58_9BACT|nr:PAS domain S-box protein [Pontibacter silvestris]MCC9136962.1 PAS domain S-box protein [Pontibacter silvestris]
MEVEQEIYLLRQQLEIEQKRRVKAEQLLQERRGEDFNDEQGCFSFPGTAFLEKLSYAILIADAGNKVVYVNKRFGELFQLPDASQAYIGEDVSLLAQLDIVAFAPLTSAITQATDENFHLEFVHENGNTIVCEAIPVEYAPEHYGTAWLYREISVKHPDPDYKIKSDLTDECPNPLIRLSYNGEILFANLAAQQQLRKLSPKKLAALQRKVQRTVSKPEEAINRYNLVIYIQGGYYHVVTSPFPEDGYINIYFHDLTEVRKRDLALAESQNFVNNIVRTVPNIIYINDFEAGKNIYLNEQVLSVLGYTKADIDAMGGNFFASIVCEEDLYKMEIHEEQMSKAGNGEIVKVEYRVRNKDGEIRWLRCRESVYKRNAGNEVKQVIGSARDITEQKLHQQELAQQKGYYETILNNLPSDIVVFDKELRIQYANLKAFKDKEVREWIIGKTQEEYGAFRNLSPEFIGRRAQHLAKALHEKQMVEFEETLLSREGETLHFLRIIKPLLDEQGQVRFMIANGLDTTELKKVQQEVIASEAKNRAILAAIPDLMFIVSRNGEFLEMSNSNQVATVLPQDKIVGSALQKMLPPDLAHELLLKINQALNTGSLISAEYVIETACGLRYREARIKKYEAEKVLVIVRDITEQKTSDKQIREKDELIRQVMNTSSNLVFVKNEKGEFTFVNKAFAVHFGRAPEDIIGKTDRDVHTQEDEVFEFTETDKLLLQTMETQSYEEKLTKSNGEVIWLRTIKKPLILESGAAHILGMSLDITAEKLAKEELEKREELYRLLSENSKDLICLHEADGTYVYLSSAVKELFGYSQSELIGTSPYDITHPEDVQNIHELRREKVLRNKENFITQHRKRRKDGSYIWVETNIRPIVGDKGQVVKLQSSTRDITQRRRANEALLISEKKYKDLIKYSQAYILSHDMKGNILSVNPFSIKNLAYTEQEIIGKALKAFLPVEQKASIDSYLDYLQEHVSFDGVFSVLDKDQQARFLHFYCYKVEESGAEPYVIAIGHDLTERLLMEEELKQAKEAAEESTRVKENFLANMSHEIRTPLNGILGMAALLGKTSLDEMQQNYLKIIKSSSDNLLVVINDILDIAKIEAGKLDIEHIPFNISETITAAFTTLMYKAEEKEIAYVLEPLPFVHSTVLGDPYRLQQVLLNLLNNALKFTDDGTVRLSATIIEDTHEAVTVEFSVSDTGIGIPEGKQQAVFEGFTQAYSSITRKYGGTGLGLNICKNLVELQGGNIWVDSQEGMGSAFRFVLTYLKSNELLENAEKPEIDYQSLGHIRVLLAEDNEINIYLAESILSSWGVSVDVACNGKEAVALASKNNYDVVLMDVQMPELNGLDATQQIRQLPDQLKANVPIIALTANAIKGDAEKYMGTGMDDYVTKPFEEEKLFMTIARHVKRKSGALQLQQGNVALVSEEDEQMEPLFDLKTIHKMSRGKEAFIKRSKQLFVDTVPAVVSDMQLKYKLQDWQGLSEAAHKLKPTIDLMHIVKLQDVVRQIENSAKAEENISEIAANIQLVSKVIPMVVNQLKAELKFT